MSSGARSVPFMEGEHDERRSIRTSRVVHALLHALCYAMSAEHRGTVDSLITHTPSVERKTYGLWESMGCEEALKSASVQI